MWIFTKDGFFSAVCARQGNAINEGPAVIVMGISTSDARRLGRQFGQLAVVVDYENSRIRLVRC
jgi:hypothetical protein